MYGMPPGFAELLQRKYDILQQQADATTTNAKSNTLTAEAAAKLDTVRAGLLPAESESEIALRRAQANYTGEQAKYFGPTALAEIGRIKADTGRLGAETGRIGEETVGMQQRNKLYKLPSFNTSGVDPIVDDVFSRGTKLPLRLRFGG